jgi:hypothetical protein
MTDILEVLAHCCGKEYLLYLVIAVAALGLIDGVANVVYSRFMARNFPRVHLPSPINKR